MASLDSSIRSAARATYSAYKRQPIRWRLAGGSAALTLVILLRLRRDRRHAHDARDLQGLQPPGRDARRPAAARGSTTSCTTRNGTRRALQAGGRSTSTTSPRRNNAAIRVITADDLRRLRARANAPELRAAASPRSAERRRLAGRDAASCSVAGNPESPWSSLQYARQISDVQATANRVKLFLGLGVLGGAALALLAGLATARRAMEPIAELTDAAREIERTRDPTETIPHPEADDEVAELARDAGVDAARARRGARGDRGDARAPARVRRRRLARAAHAADLGARQPRAARGDARRRAARGRRLGAALLAPHAPPRRRPAAARARRRRPRQPPHAPVDLSDVVTDAASELEPVAGDHEISISAPRGRARSRARATSCTGSC